MMLGDRVAAAHRKGTRDFRLLESVDGLDWYGDPAHIAATKEELPPGERPVDGIYLVGKTLPDCDFSGLLFLGGFHAPNSVLHCIRLAKCSASRQHGAPWHLPGADLTGGDLRGIRMQGARVEKTNFTRVDLRGANLEGATFVKCDFTGADLRNALVDDSTTFDHCVVEGCRIDRFTTESLSEECGLSDGHMMRMKIEDDVATLRADYSGFWQWIHLMALALFVAPYLTFIVRQVLFATRVCSGSNACTPLYESLGAYIWTGGRFEGFAAIPFLVLCFSLAYNLLRFVLLAKTKTLELQHLARGFHVRFSLEDTIWGSLLKAAHIGFWINVGLVVIHTAHFLGTYVPAR